MKVVAILQARMGSTRLKGKVLLPLAGKPLVQNVIERVHRSTKVHEVVLAVPSKDLDAFLPFAKMVHLYAYPLDENDLVGRYLAAAKAYEADIVVRVPCDNPCVDPVYIDRAIEDYLDLPRTFLSNTTDYIKDYGWIDGIGVEVFSITRLRWLDRVIENDPELREHPHKFFYDWRFNHPEDEDGISRNLVEPFVRLDVNTQADYEFIKGIYDHFTHNHFTTAEVLAYLESKPKQGGVAMTMT